MDTLSQEQIEAALGELDGWGFEGEALTRTFRFADFVHAVGFVEHLAEVAEEQQHHPDIDIRYNKVTLRLSSHDAGGVTHARRQARGGDPAPRLRPARPATGAGRAPAARAAAAPPGRRARMPDRALVAQGIRARASGARGRRFESFRGHH